MARSRRPKFYPTEDWTDITLIGRPGDLVQGEYGDYHLQEVEPDGRRYSWMMSPKEREAISGYEQQSIGIRKVRHGRKVDYEVSYDQDEQPRERSRREPERRTEPEPRRESDSRRSPTVSAYVQAERAVLRIRARLQREGLEGDDLRATTNTLFIAFDRNSWCLEDIPTVSDEEAGDEERSQHGRESDFQDEVDVPF